jgi:hypothetical protein
LVSTPLPAACQDAVVTPFACSRQLLCDAAFYELPEVHAALPRVLLTELRAAHHAVVSAAGFAAVIQLVATAEEGDTAGLCAAALGTPPVAAPALREAATRALRIVVLLRWVPPAYLAASTVMADVLSELCRLEKVLVCALACATDCCALMCETLRALRAAATALLAAAAEPVAHWSTAAQLEWSLGSLQLLCSSASSAFRGSLNWRSFESAAVQTGAMLQQLLQAQPAVSARKTAKTREAVVAAVLQFCSDLDGAAARYAASSATVAKAAPCFLPRVVVLQQPRASQVRRRKPRPAFVLMHPDSWFWCRLSRLHRRARTCARSCP